MLWQLCCWGAKKPFSWTVTGLELVSSGPSPRKSGTVQVNRCGFPQGLLLHSGHTRMQRRLNPGFGPVARGRSLSSSPQKPLSLAAMPYFSTVSSFSHSSLLFQIFFIILHLCRLHFSSFMFFFHFLPQIFFITCINTSQLSSHLSSTPLSLIPTPGMSFRLSSTFLLFSVEAQSPVAAALECQTVIY